MQPRCLSGLDPRVALSSHNSWSYSFQVLRTLSEDRSTARVSLHCGNPPGLKETGRAAHEPRQVLLTAPLWQFGALVEDLQVAMIRKEAMALFAGSLPNHAELHHVLQSLRHSGRRERELLSRRRDRDDRLPLKVLVNAQN